MHTHRETEKVCMCVCIKRLLKISALVLLSSVSIQVIGILAKPRKRQAYFIFTQFVC